MTEASTFTPLFPPLARWLTRQMLDDARVALVDVAADVDTRIQLTDVFVDLPLASPPGRALATLCEGGETEPPVSSRWLLVGGPGSGKTTLTTMLAQVLRRRHVEASIITVPERERREAPRVYDAIEEAERALRLKVSPGLPLRIDLPSLAVWLASAGDGASVARFLAEQIRSSLGEEEGCDEAWVRRELLARRDLYWIFDGLDEVPASTNRDVVIRVVRDAVMGSHARLVVTTRPQSYAGEFDDLQPLQLAPIEAHVAQQYAMKLTEAWVGRGDRLTKRVEQLELEFARPELADLLRSPLHVAMAALLVARDGRLPPSRWALLDKYVVHIFERELRKNIETGVTDADGPNLRVIHARAGLVLHVRSARATGTRPLLRPSELRRLIEAKLREDAPEDEALASVERLLRFADERLVLLLRESEHGYGFAVRSLQEFFAAKALLEDPVRAPERVRAVALDPHWLNVVLLLASRGLLAATDHEKDETLKLTAEVCEAIDAGLIRPEAAIPKLGARLAQSMLCETEHATWTKLHDPLWKVVFRGVEGPLRYSLTEGSRSSLMFALSKARVSAVWDERASLQLRVGRTLARWSGKRAEPLRARARELAARLLEAGGELRQSGIDLLAGLLTHDDRAALDLMSGTPWSPDEASLLVSRLLDWENPGGVPVAARTLAKAMPAVFTPGHLLRSGVRLGYDSVDFDALSAAWRVRDAADKKLKVQIDETNFSVALHALTDIVSSVWEEVAEFASTQTDPVWHAWADVARFHASPTRASLVGALESIARTGNLTEFQSLSRVAAWPLSACFVASNSPQDLTSLAARLQGGALGDLDTWLRAEARWREASEVTLNAFTDSLLLANSPWVIAAGELVGLPASLSFSQRFSPEGSAEEPSVRAGLLALARTLEPLALKAVREFQTFFAVIGTDSDSALPLELAAAAPPFERDSPSSILHCLELVLPDLAGPRRERWLDLLDTWGQRFEVGRYVARSSIHGVRRAKLATLLDELVPLASTRPGLLVVILALLYYVPEGDLTALRIPRLGDDASPKLDATATLLRLLCGPLPESLSEVLSSLRGSVSGETFDFVPTLAFFLSLREPSDSLKRLSTLYHAAPDDTARSEFAAALHAQLGRDMRPSFASSEEWERYGFPGTFPGLQPPVPAPVRIVSLDTLANLRLFKDTPRLLAPLPTPTPGTGQWVVLLGENGVGKTTLLRALALCLAPSGVATKLLDDRLPMVRNGGSATIRVTLDTGPLEAHIEREGTPPAERVVSEEGHERPWVVGYGVRRGNARGESDREPEPGVFGALHTLFERPGTLYNAVAWLLALRRRLLEEEDLARRAGIRDARGPERRTWDAVERGLRRVLLDERMEIETRGDHVMIRHRLFGFVRLDALSDGYLTTTGWVIDLIARWVERQRAAGEPVGDLLREMVGVVLLDEIDLHLHPIWQMRIIEDVRALFPRLSFVVTTHNPLTLQGARRGEVFVMRRDEDGAIEVAQQDVMPGYDIDRVLLEQFGVEYTFDRETRGLLAEYRTLRERGTPEGDPRRRELEEVLSIRLGPIGRRVQENLRGPTDSPRRLSPEEADTYRKELRARRGRS